MLSCYTTTPDDATITLLAEELIRKHTNQLKEGEAPHYNANVKFFTRLLKKSSFDKDAAFTLWTQYCECVRFVSLSVNLTHKSQP